MVVVKEMMMMMMMMIQGEIWTVDFVLNGFTTTITTITTTKLLPPIAISSPSPSFSLTRSQL